MTLVKRVKLELSSTLTWVGRRPRPGKLSSSVRASCSLLRHDHPGARLGWVTTYGGADAPGRARDEGGFALERWRVHAGRPGGLRLRTLLPVALDTQGRLPFMPCEPFDLAEPGLTIVVTTLSFA